MEDGDDLPSLPEYFPTARYEPNAEVEISHSAERYGDHIHTISMTGEGLGRWLEIEFDTCDSDYRKSSPGLDCWNDYLELARR